LLFFPARNQNKYKNLYKTTKIKCFLYTTLQINKNQILKNFYAADSSNRYLNAVGQVKKFNAWAKHNNLNYRLVIKKNTSKWITFLLYFAIGLVIVATLKASLIYLKLLALPMLVYVSLNKISKPRLEEVSPDFYDDEPVAYESNDLTYRQSSYLRDKVNPEAVFLHEPSMNESNEVIYRGSHSVLGEEVNSIIKDVATSENLSKKDLNVIDEGILHTVVHNSELTSQSDEDDDSFSNKEIANK
jgi:hypothetical protein